jgi:hypothetical protein
MITGFFALTGFLFNACEETPLEYNDQNPANSDPPVIQEVLPTKAFLKDTVIVDGNGFNSNPEHNYVKFGNKSGTIISATENELRVIVPEGSGDTVKVTAAVKGAVDWSNGVDFVFEQTIKVLDEEIEHPSGVAIDDDGNVYVGGRVDEAIFKITPSGEKSVFVADIPVNGALHFGPGGFLYVCEQYEGKIVRISSDGQTIEDHIIANSPIEFDWDLDGKMYIVSNWEGIYRDNGDGTLDYVVVNGDIKTIRIFEDKVYAGAAWANQGLRFDITASGLENEEVIIEAGDLVLGLDIDMNGQIYYGLYFDPTLHTLGPDGSEG